MRERKQLPGGDLARSENQRKVIKAIVQKDLGAEVISDPATFTSPSRSARPAAHVPPSHATQLWSASCSG
jgi:hypothetical protein